LTAKSSRLSINAQILNRSHLSGCLLRDFGFEIFIGTIMPNNVIILGAGASRAAGIPLMGGFMDQMWNLAKKGKHRDAKLNSDDQKLLSDALSVRDELDEYHGRASLDVWNLEEVLSILSLNALAGRPADKKKLELMTRAIARTIEITCDVRHSGALNIRTVNGEGVNPLYNQFWHTLFAWCRARNEEMPFIITFNYDLVLERSLLHALIGTAYGRHRRFPSKGIIIDYHTRVMRPIALGLKHAAFHVDADYHRTEPGYILEELDPVDPDSQLTKINIVKLHGSNNFSKKGRIDDEKKLAGPRLVEAAEDPLIMPPVFNKASQAIGAESWASALDALRSCKNIIVCGYSLPVTDIYMQYFLKAALGPNQDLNKITVFDPCLFSPQNSSDGESLRRRYGANFSVPIQKRIDYSPPGASNWPSGHGSMEHLVWLLNEQPDSLLFG
jgi:hypothetical protein